MTGVVNGFVSHHYRVPPLIITLGYGLGRPWGGPRRHARAVYGSVPPWFTQFVSPGRHRRRPPRAAPVVVFWIVLTLVIGVVLHLTGIGRRLYATGANERAARLALVSTERVWVVAFAASAVCSAIAGIVLAAWSGTGEQTIGDPYLFLTIAAVIIGGTSLVGARGDYWRTVLGSLILIVLTTNLVGHSYSEATQQIILGLIILAAVGTYGRDRALRDRV